MKHKNIGLRFFQNTMFMQISPFHQIRLLVILVWKSRLKGTHEHKVHNCLVIKSLLLAKAAWADITHTKFEIACPEFILRKVLFLRQILTPAMFCYLIFFQLLYNGNSVDMFYKKNNK